ncbi:hypothetical protein [Streptomyces sp. NPDC003077]|uniref:hypothetical protein n=1 Tax=Streptomyces sp. NPDC003077 TaxID=3154443 RepID=UPI0033A079D3
MEAVTGKVVPYITARQGEEADSHFSLCSRFGKDGRQQLAYIDEGPDDRDPRGVLWARLSHSIHPDGLPAGSPKWRMVHPARQRECMLLLRCQVCVQPLKHPNGVLFLETAAQAAPDGPVQTAQPPVCLQHARMAAERCPHLARKGHVALMANRYPLYGVIGTPYQYGSHGLTALAFDDRPIPYGSPLLRWLLASQLVRELRAYQVVRLDDLVPVA